jgi:hypothetical protein
MSDLGTSGNYHKIEPTADLVTYWREFSDIPFAYEISYCSDARKKAEAIYKENLAPLGIGPEEAIKALDAMTPWGAVFTEGRYKCVDQWLDNIGIKNVYEAASGLCPRPLNRTKDPSVKYVATDLPERLHANEAFLREVMKRNGVDRQNLEFALSMSWMNIH